jgi:hypothetical protein
MKEKPINYDDLPLHSIWDGYYIRRTDNCDGCKFLVPVLKDKEELEVCDWGIAWEVLREVDNPRKCVKVDKEPPEESSSNDIERIK